MKDSLRIIVIGGGAAGFFAAITAAEKNPKADITILEKGNTVLGKVKVSGGGRCNVTNACFNPKDLISYYPRGGRALLGPFHTFNTSDTVEWFERRGVKLKAEADGRMFPITDSSQTIVDLFIDSAHKNRIRILTRNGVNNVINNNNKWILETSMGELEAERVLAASGSSIKMWKILKSLGHTINEPVPSLFTFNIKDSRLEGLQGIAVENTETAVEGTALKEKGPLLITHWGLSGPGILKLSAWGARELSRMNYKFTLSINFTGGLTKDITAERLKEIREKNLKSGTASINSFSIPARLWTRMTEGVNIHNKRWSGVSNKEINLLAEALTAAKFKVSGKSTFKEEFVTCGGVNLDEVNFKKMESKLVEGLFFAGEILDVDAVTGGFNFQAAWTTGFIAGNNIAD